MTVLRSILTLSIGRPDNPLLNALQHAAIIRIAQCQRHGLRDMLYRLLPLFVIEESERLATDNARLTVLSEPAIGQTVSGRFTPFTLSRWVAVAGGVHHIPSSASTFSLSSGGKYDMRTPRIRANG
ncbi:MAG: hypothetical protein RL291_1632 [Pseudomonadota bacterium]|jgi:hypothetical protein